MVLTGKVAQLHSIIQEIADERPNFFKKKGQGIGNADTNSFVAELHKRAKNKLGADYSEQRICGDTHHAVDFYFEDEATIVELALGLRTPNSEYEKDILKALLAQENYAVKRLVLIGKEGAVKQCNQPARTALRDWALRAHDLTVEVYDIENRHESKPSS